MASDGGNASPDEGLADLQALPSSGDAFRIALPNFEGPLDLLLHLIREHRLDIFDIPIALITERYLAYLEAMREVNLDIAGEFLVMAATLAHIKSRLLLPREEAAATASDVEPDAQGDPRAELVRRLLEYQKYKEVAESLGRQGVLDRDVFVRRVSLERQPIPEGEVGFVEVSVYKLIESLDRVLAIAEPDLQHEIVRERISISDAIHRIAERLRAERQVSFFSLFEVPRTRGQILVVFLAILEMAKLKLIRVHQEDGQGDILVSAKGSALDALSDAEVDENEYK